MGGLAALVTLTHCGGPDAGERVDEAAGPQRPSTLRQEVATVLSFSPSADARVEAASPTSNFGGERKLVADQSPELEGYVRFNVSGVSGTVTRAVLRLYALDGTSNGPQLYITGGGWTETGLTWNNRPIPDSSPIDDLGAISSGSWVEYDLTGVVRGNHQYDFALVSRSGNGADFASREYSRAELRPRLVLTVEPSPDCMLRTDTQVFDLPANDDGYASQSQPTRRFGDAPELLVDAAPSRLEAFLQFRFTLPPAWQVRGAKLRLHATDYTPDGPLLYRASDDWSQGDFDWYTRPFLLGNPLGDLGVVNAGTWAEYDVSSVVTTGSGVYSFGLLPESTNGVDFVSTNGSAYSLFPRLLLDMAAEPYCTYQGTGGGLTGWTRHYGGAGPERLHALATDSQGGFVTAGLFGDAPFPNGTGFALARYTVEGMPSWTRQVTTDNVRVSAITVTPVGNILVVGNYGGSPDLGTGPLPTAPASNERALFIAKFSPSGETEWAQGFLSTYVRPGESGVEYWPVTPRAVATDANGSVILVGDFQGQVDFGGGPLFAGLDSVTGGAIPGGFIAKFSWQGWHLWSKALVAGDFNLPTRVRAVSTDGEGSVFVGGAVNSNADLGDGPVGTYGPFIAKYDASGALLWKRLWPGTPGEVMGVQPLGTTDVAFVANLSGSFTFGGRPYAGGDPGEAPSPNNVTGFLGALSTWGADEWLRPLGPTRVQELVTASDQSITFTGHGYEYDLGGGPLGTSSFARHTPYVARYTASGMHVWSRAFDRNLDVSGFTPMLLLARQPGGSVVVGSDFISPILLDGRTYTPRGSADLLYFQLKP